MSGQPRATEKDTRLYKAVFGKVGDWVLMVMITLVLGILFVVAFGGLLKWVGVL